MSKRLALAAPICGAAIAWDRPQANSVLNEFISYQHMASLPQDALSAGSRRILTYAMCGFANFGSLGILVGGMGAMLPERRAEVATLGLRSILSGTIATCMSGALAGVLG